VLHCFAHEGGFPGPEHGAGAEQVTAIEIKEGGGQLHACENATDRHRGATGECLDALHDLERQRAQYESIILDPPASQVEGKLHEAARGYKEIHCARAIARAGRMVATVCARTM